MAGDRAQTAGFRAEQQRGDRLGGLLSSSRATVASPQLPFVLDLSGARAFAALGRELAERYPVAIALHTDHCPPADADSFLWSHCFRTPTGESSVASARSSTRICSTARRFHSRENLRGSAALLDRCRKLDILLEAECGVVGGEDDGIGNEGVSRDRLYTTP